MAAGVHQVAPDNINGQWTNEDKTMAVAFSKAGTVYKGVVVKGPNTANVGKELLTDLVYKDGRYTGRIYLPKKNKKYPCTIVLKSDNTMEITVSVGFISQTKKWSRV